MTSPRAQSAFNAVYGQVPGELAPKLALALACERGGEGEIAEALYRICASTDANYVAPAAFGMARVRAARGDVAGAVAALDLVPSTSRSYTEARRLRAIQLYESGQGLPALAQAMDSLNGVSLDPRDSGRADRGDPGAGGRRGRQERTEDRRDDRPVRRPRGSAAGRAGAHLPHAGRDRDR